MLSETSLCPLNMSQPNTNIVKVCTDLTCTLGACHCNPTNTKQSSSKENNSAKKTKKSLSEPNKKWGFSTELMLYDDPWKIKKVLTQSDLGNMSRLLLKRELVENLVLPILDIDHDCDNGVRFNIWDVDTNSMHSLVFKRWCSSKTCAYVFIENGVKDFVDRRGLKKGDEIGLHWNPYNNVFNFRVLKVKN